MLLCFLPFAVPPVQPDPATRPTLRPADPASHPALRSADPESYSKDLSSLSTTGWQVCLTNMVRLQLGLMTPDANASRATDSGVCPLPVLDYENKSDEQGVEHLSHQARALGWKTISRNLNIRMYLCSDPEVEKLR